jgi:tRNA pseudouridine38-40 synthase
MFYYKAIISYKGTNYFGWQTQTSTTETVQGKLTTALKIICKTHEVKILGSGRTDTGVHAYAQVARFTTPIEIPADSLVKAMNCNLPDDIRVKQVEACPETFNPLRDAKKKEYRYKFTNSKIPNALSNDYFTNFSYDLDFELMRKACEILIGEKDFTYYYTLGSNTNTTIRSIFDCEIVHVQSDDDTYPEHYYLRVVGSGFLKQMVRLIMGTIWNVGRGKVSILEFKDSLEGDAQDKLAAVAPPEGLFLYSVTYN